MGPRAREIAEAARAGALPLTVPLDRELSTRVLQLAAIAVIAFVGAALFAPILEITLLLFSGLLVAVALDAAASWPARRLGLPRGFALALVSTLGMLAGVWFVIALYLGIQLVETYVISPVLQRRMLSLPPALTLGAQAVLGVIAGSIGVVVATPIVAAVVAAVMARDQRLARELTEPRVPQGAEAALRPGGVPAHGPEPTPA